MEKPAHQRTGSVSSNRIIEMMAVHVKLKEVTATVAESCVDQQSMIRLHAIKRSFNDFPQFLHFARLADRELTRATKEKKESSSCGLQLHGD